MGLDAVVFCNCVEEEKLKVPHPFPTLLKISKDGRPYIRSRDIRKIEAHDTWMALPPCGHDDMMVDGCSLGNAGGVDVIFAVILKAQTISRRKLPILLNRVFYSGTHCGDFLTVEQLKKLDLELKVLRGLKSGDLGIAGSDAKWMKEVFDGLASLVRVALRISKPIVF